MEVHLPQQQVQIGIRPDCARRIYRRMKKWTLALSACFIVRRIRWAPAAAVDLESIRDYLHEHHPAFIQSACFTERKTDHKHVCEKRAQSDPGVNGRESAIAVPPGSVTLLTPQLARPAGQPTVSWSPRQSWPGLPHSYGLFDPAAGHASWPDSPRREYVLPAAAPRSPAL